MHIDFCHCNYVLKLLEEISSEKHQTSFTESQNRRLGLPIGW